MNKPNANNKKKYWYWHPKALKSYFNSAKWTKDANDYSAYLKTIQDESERGRLMAEWNDELKKMFD